jgi:uracil-DNA glycosylase
MDLQGLYMADHTLKKVSDWLKFQEEVYGSFRSPRAADNSTAFHAAEGLNETPAAKGVNVPPAAKDEIITHGAGNVIEKHGDVTLPAVNPVNEGSHRGSVTVGDGTKSTTSLGPYAGLSGISGLDELKTYCHQAAILRTDLESTNLVFGVGNARADLMLIGEAPGEQEDRQGEPFVGKAGQLLNKILKAISFERDQVYIANILKHRPPNNRDPLPEERENSLPILEKQIDLINPKLILCLGRISAQTLLETAAPMKELRGRFHQYRDKYEVLVTYHPAALLRNPEWKRGTWEDVQLLRKRYDELGCQP